MAVGDPALVLAEFAPVRALPAVGGATVVGDHLASFWATCQGLGMRDAIPGLGRPRELRLPSPNDDFYELELLAGCERRQPAGVAQALAFGVHDGVVVAAVLAGNRGAEPLARWRELHAEWIASRTPTPLPSDMLGAATVFWGLADVDDPEGKLAGAIAESLPARGESPAPLTYARTRDDLHIWEATGDQRTVLAVLAPPAREVELNRWLWWDAGAGIRGLETGLLHLLLLVCKLRHQHRVYRRRAEQLAVTEARTAVALTGLLGFHDSLQQRQDRRDRFPLDELLAARDRLVREQTRSGGLALELSELRDLRRTLVIAGENLGALLPAPHREGTRPPFARDRRLAAALPAQIDNDVDYLTNLQERVREVESLVAARVQQATEYHARDQKRLTLFQTTLVGALLGGLGAIGTLKPDVRLEGDLRLPVVALLAAALLAIPHLIVNWPERYRGLDYALTGLLGAAAGWFTARLAEAHPAAAVALVAGGALTAPAAAWLLEKTVAARHRHWLRQRPEWHLVRRMRQRLS
jgi:hypothetical protein